MYNRRFCGKKNAGVTIEFTLSIALSVVILFLAIGLFSSNMQTFADKSAINNLAKKAKVADWGKTNKITSTINVAQSQQEVQVVADQGLGWYLDNAQSTISKYKDRTDLSQAEAEDLAKALMIAKMSGITTDSTGTSIDYVSFYKNNGIKVIQDVANDLFTTTITNDNTKVELSYKTGNLNSSDAQLIAVQSITKDVFR